MERAHMTTDHEKIRKWAEARGGHPSDVKETGSADDPGILRIDFDPPEQKLEQISWDEFFAKFDEADLAFLYQDKTADGKISRFHKFVARQSADEDEDEEEDEDEDDED